MKVNIKKKRITKPPQEKEMAQCKEVEKVACVILCFFFLRLKEARRDLRVLLLGHTNSTPMAPSSLGVLTTDTETPAMTQATMVFHFL